MSEITERLTTAIADRYKIERHLGQGGMATVYLAHDVKHDRKVALKVLRPELAAVIGAERFLHEIKVTANLQHPNILALYDSGEADTFLYYVMPYVEGDTLRDKLDREKQLAVDDAIEITKSVATALDYAHRHDVIHRDIKPENILIHDGQALVADFGIALAVSQAAGNRLTETGLSLGTPHYMSPEQAMGERELDARTDVYSLGVMLYEMLVGEPPFTGPTAQAIVAKVITEKAPLVTATRDTTPPHIAAAVQKALSKLPADRFHSAAEFGEALVTPGAVPASTTRQVAAEPRGTPWRRIALVSGALALGFAALAFWAWRHTPPQPVVRVTMVFPDGERLRSLSTRLFAIAPDGSRLVYLGPDSAGTRLWVREMNALSARPLPGTNGALAPFFSPDGMSVAFFTGDPGDLRIVRVSGGPALTVVRDSAAPWGGYWHDDGMLYFSNQNSQVARVPSGGGTIEELSVLDTASGAPQHDWVQPLPGGKAALIQIWHNSIADAEIGLVDFETGQATPILDGAYGRYIPTGHIVYATFGGSLLAVPFDAGRLEVTGSPTAIAEQVQVDPFSASGQFAISHTGTLLYLPGGGLGSQQVVWVDRDGQMTAVDTTWRGSFGTLALSPDATQIAVSIISADGEHVWVKQLPGGPLSRLTFGGTNSTRPVWTPDGRRIAFVSDRANSRRQVFVQRSDGSADADSLMAHPRQVDQITWTPDGRGFAFRTGSSGSHTRDLYAFTMGDTAPRPLVVGAFDEFAPDISPDGRWFAYVSNEAGRDQVFVRRFGDPGAGRTQVSADGGNEPRWAHSGRELFFRTRRGEMMVAGVTLGATFSARPACFSSFPTWEPTPITGLTT